MKVGEVYLIKLDEADEKWTSISELLEQNDKKDFWNIKDIWIVKDIDNSEPQEIWTLGEISGFNITFELLYDKNPGLEQIMDDHPELFV